MAVCDVDVGEVPVVCLHPVDKLLILIDGEERVDQHGVTPAEDQRRGVGDPLEIFRARRQVAGETQPPHAQGVELQR